MNVIVMQNYNSKTMLLSLRQIGHSRVTERSLKAARRVQLTVKTDACMPVYPPGTHQRQVMRYTLGLH